MGANEQSDQDIIEAPDACAPWNRDGDARVAALHSKIGRPVRVADVDPKPGMAGTKMTAREEACSRHGTVAANRAYSNSENRVFVLAP